MKNPQPLPAHPYPDLNKTIGKWIEELAKSNSVDFAIMGYHIGGYAANVGFENALNLLTRVPVETISQLKNEFKSDFWLNNRECPIKDCDYIANKQSRIFTYVGIHHDLGVKLYYCPEPECAYKAKESSTLKQHLAYRHDIGVKWHQCTHCERKYKRGSTLKSHLSNKHEGAII